MGSTRLNLLLDVGFNREVGEDTALYWTKADGSLSSLIARCDNLPWADQENYGQLAKARIRSAYSWESVSDSYANAFLRNF